jgi:hypothetical protein
MTKNVKSLTVGEKIETLLLINYSTRGPSSMRSIKPSKNEHPALQNIKCHTVLK